MKTIPTLLLAALCVCSCTGNKSSNRNSADDSTRVPQQEWVSLFNGKDLDGWTVKITGYPAGENFGNTFRVEDGLMKVRYDAYDEFKDRFGHIFAPQKYSNYKMRVEYRFVGDQVKGGAGWAYRNSGIMFHAQSPESMHIDQDFPVSIEAQFLGGNGTDERTTGNVCTPGTEVYINNEPYKAHCYSSNSKTYHGDEWVTFEMVVYSDSLVHHIMDGDTILTYTNLTVGGGNVSPAPNIAAGPLKEGYVALQSESHPLDIRRVEVMELR